MKYKYTTLKGLISKTNQFSLSNFLSSRIYHIKKGHIDFKISPEVEEEIKSLFGDFLGLANFKYPVNCGIFERLIIEKDLKVRYIAGQDYPGELRYIRKLLK